MKERILEFLKTENKSSAQFAEEIGVQPSGISHILSGRNNPSLDFVIRMLKKYPGISTDWLLFGKGSMYSEKPIPDLFESVNKDFITSPVDVYKNGKKGSGHFDNSEPSGNGLEEKNGQADFTDIHKAQRIVCFFNDNTFSEYFPAD